MITQNYMHRRQNGFYYFCVNVPKRLLTPTTRRQIRRPLRTRDLATAKVRVAAHIAEILPLFEQDILPEEAKVTHKRAKQKAKQWNLPYTPHSEIITLDRDQLIDVISEKIVIREMKPELNQIEVAALVGAVETPPLMWMDAFEKFKACSFRRVKDKNPVQTTKFWKRYENKVKHYIAEMGDVDVLKITKNDAKRYKRIVQEKLDRGEFKSNEANQRISWLGTILEDVFEYEYEGKDSPFTGVTISGYDDDGKKSPFTSSEIVAIETALEKSSVRPEIKALIRIGKCTGANAKELALLTADQIHLDAPIPYISIGPNAIRGKVKRGGARHRDLPLVGDALAAMREFPNGFTIFHTVNGPDQVNGSMSEFFRKATPGKGKGFGSFRHSMADWLRRSGCNDTLKDSILGHTNSKSHSMHYGEGYEIENKMEAIKTALEYSNLKK